MRVSTGCLGAHARKQYDTETILGSGAVVGRRHRHYGFVRRDCGGSRFTCCDSTECARDGGDSVGGIRWRMVPSYDGKRRKQAVAMERHSSGRVCRQRGFDGEEPSSPWSPADHARTGQATAICGLQPARAPCSPLDRSRETTSARRASRLFSQDKLHRCELALQRAPGPGANASTPHSWLDGAGPGAFACPEIKPSLP